MKQRITIKQWNQLGDEANGRFKQWMADRGYIEQGFRYEDSCLPNIGQMIEFLDEKDDYFKTWYREGKSKISKECRTFEWSYEEEPCDALWQATKEVLEK